MTVKHNSTKGYNESANIELLCGDVTNFIYSSSKISPKKVLLNLQEAKDLFRLPTPKSDQELGLYLYEDIKDIDSDSIPAFARRNKKLKHKKNSRSEGYVQKPPRITKIRQSVPTAVQDKAKDKYSIIIEKIQEKTPVKVVKYFSSKSSRNIELNPEIIDEVNAKLDEGIVIPVICYSEESPQIKIADELSSREISDVTDSFEYTQSEELSSQLSLNFDSIRISNSLKDGSLSNTESISNTQQIDCGFSNPFDLALSEERSEELSYYDPKPSRQVVYEISNNLSIEEGCNKTSMGTEEDLSEGIRISTYPSNLISKDLNPVVVSFMSIDENEDKDKADLSFKRFTTDTRYSNKHYSEPRVEFEREEINCTCGRCGIF